MAVVITLDLRHSLEKRSKSIKLNAKENLRFALLFVLIGSICYESVSLIGLQDCITCCHTMSNRNELSCAKFQCFLDVFQSEVWIDDPVEKKKLIEDYKSALRFTE